MGANSSRVKYGFDGEAGVTLASSVTTTLGAGTTSQTGIDLGGLNAAYWQDGEAPHGTFAVNVKVDSAVTGASETYELALRIADDSAISAGDIVASLELPAGSEPGIYEMVVDSDVLDQLLSDNTSEALYMGIEVVQTVATAQMVYSAWIADSIRG